MKKRIIQNNGVNQVALTNSNDNQITIINSPIEHMSMLIQEGRLEEAVRLFKRVYNETEKLHPLYPSYIYKPIEFGSKIVFEHKPANQKIAEQLPLQYRGKFSIKDKDFLQGDNLNDFLRRKYFNQEKVRIDMKYIETWIGEQLIEDSFTLEKHIVDTGEWFIFPEKLPPPIKAKLVLSDCETDRVIIDYLELRVKEASNKENTIVISNNHQKSSPIMITLTMPRIISEKSEIVSTSKIDINIREEFEGSVIAEKTFLEFIKYSSHGSRMCFVEIEKQREFIKADGVDLDAAYESIYIDERLVILSDLMQIEKTFNIQFKLPRKMEQDDFNLIEILKSIVNDKEIKSTIENVNATFESGAKTELIKIINKDKPMMIGFRENIEINLFGEKFDNIEASFKIENVVVDNPERVRKKLEYLDDGETIKINFNPGTKNNSVIKYKMKE